MRTATLLLLLGCAANSQQLTIQPSSVPDHEIVGPQSPQFDTVVSAIVGPDRPTGLAASLPFGIVIRNSSPEALAAIDIVWTRDGDNHVLLNATEQRFPRPDQFIKPGQAVLAIPPGLLDDPRQLRIFSEPPGGNRLESFAGVNKATVVVDSVVYGSGRFVGADRYRAFERWQAQLNAPKELATTVLQKKQTESIGEIVSWIDSLAQPRRYQSGDEATQETALAARRLQLAYRRQGEAGLYSRAAAMAAQPAFPLHR